MRKDGAATKTAILDSTQKLILKYGYGGMTVDDVIRKAGLSKGAFFYHFRSKEDLAESLVHRFAEQDKVQLDELMAQAERLTADPVSQLLLFVGLYIDFLDTAEEMPDGCLYASFCYESGLVDSTTLQPIRDMVLYWRERLVNKIREAMETETPRVSIDPDAVADLMLVCFEGAFVLTKTLKERRILIQQLDQYRRYLALLFSREHELPQA